tara:strand:+ start:199 stop:576 length:378 start_codon:yes stop_codon:yes gene_type:complete
MAATEAWIDYNYNLNSSLAVGDLLYCVCALLDDGFLIGNGEPILFAELTEIKDGVIGFHHSGYGVGLPTNIPCGGGTRFISFSKDKTVNETSLKGYYNLVTFLNDDNHREAEMFMVNSEVAVSSK